MKTVFVLVLALVLAGAPAVWAFERDVIQTSAGDLAITFIGHGTLMLEFGGKVIHVDPVGEYADYAALPKADLVLITHAHRDHLDPVALAAVRTEKTVVVVSAACEGKVASATVMRNGESRELLGIPIAAVPAYNLVHMRKDGTPFHPKGEGNGYLLTCGETRVLIAGDTENVPELETLVGVDVAFLPMNLPYTMTVEMVADLARKMRPKILYPYHFGNSDTSRLQELLKDSPSIEVRIRKMS